MSEKDTANESGKQKETLISDRTVEKVEIEKDYIEKLKEQLKRKPEADGQQK